MNLSLRLTEVKNTVLPTETVCDIGCDHGFVSIAMIQEGLAKKVIACDINKGPLEAAKNNIAAAGLSDYIETRLSDGLHKVSIEDKADAVVIAGMGGALMTKILTEGMDVIKGASQLILQPQSEIFLVRIWLRDNCYNIVSEKMIKDMGKYYFIIDARPGKSGSFEPDLQKIYDDYSEYLIKTKNPVLKEYLIRGLETNKGYMEGISPDKRQTLQEKNDEIKKALTMMET